MAHNKSSFFSDRFSDWRSCSTTGKWLYITYALVLVPNILTMIRAVEKRVGLSFLIDFSDVLFIGFAVLMSISVFIKRVKIVDVAFVIFLIIWHTFSSWIYPQTAVYSNENAFYFIFLCLPFFFVGLTFDNKISLNILTVIAFISLVTEAILLFYIGLGDEVKDDDSTHLMTRAYTFLPAVLIFICNTLERKSIISGLLSLLSIFILFSMGTRGPIMCVVFFIAVYLMLFKKFKYDLLIKSAIMIFAVVFYVFSEPILLFASILTASLGLSTRIYDSILDAQMVQLKESSGRDVLFSDIFHYLNSNDLYFNAGFYTDFVATSDHLYAHNLELEFLCDFGMIGGAVMLIILFSTIYIAFKRVWHTSTAMVLFIFFCSSIMPLQFSSTWLRFGLFWLFLGMCISIIRINKKTHSQSVLKGRLFKRKPSIV